MRMNIVIIDDYEEHANTLASFLSNEDHDVYVYTKVDGLINLLRQRDPHLIICDGLMEGKRAWKIGYEFLREYPEHKRPYMVALTGFGSTMQRRLCEECGFDEYATKPIEHCTLLEWARRARVRADELGHLMF